MAPRNDDDCVRIPRAAWEMLIRQIEFNTQENQRISDKLLVMETSRRMLGTIGGVVVPIIVSIMTAVAMKFLHL